MVEKAAVFIGRVRSSAFLRHNAVYFFGSLATGAFNYLYYPILAHLLKLSVYGEVQALVALSLQLTIFITVLSQVTVNVVATYDDELQKRRVAFELEKLALCIGLGVFVIGGCLSWRLSTFFHFDSIWPFVVLLVLIIVTAPSSFRSAYLNGHKKFGATAIYNVLTAVSRLIFSVVFVLIGWGAVGAIAGLVVAQLIAFAYTAYEAHKVGFGQATGLRYFSLPHVRLILPELKYGLFIFVSSIGVTLLSSIDVFVVKHYFDAKTAGRYAGISSVGRIIFFLTASIAQVMLPSVRKNRPATENRRYLARSLALLGGVGGLALLWFAVLPRFTIGLLMGRAYLTYASLLPALSLAMFLISVLNLLVYYYIALRVYRIGFVVIASMALTIGFMALSHGSLRAVVYNVIWGSAVMLGMFAAWNMWARIAPRRTYAKATE